MVTTHGVHGLLFAAINCGAIGICSMLFSRRRAVATAVGLLYVTAWLITVASSESVREEAVSRCRESLTAATPTQREVTQFHHDPVKRNTPEQGQWPWFHIGDASVPCPFVVVFDHATMTETYGYGGRAHLLWILGYTWNLSDSPRWVHC